VIPALWLAAGAALAAAPLSPAGWLEAVQETRAALDAQAPDGVDRLRELARAEVDLGGGRLMPVRDPLLPVLAEAMGVGVIEARSEALRHLAAVERQAAALAAAPPASPPPVAPLTAAPAAPIAGRPEGLAVAGQALRAWVRSLGGGAPGLALLLGGVVSCGLLAGVLTALRRQAGVEAVAPRPAAPPLAPPAPQELAGSGRLAVREAFLEMLALLERGGQVERPGFRTNGGVARALEGEAWEAFQAARSIYERCWYGGVEPSEGEALRVREALSAARRRR
jgi:hypothetical protein